MLKIDNQSESVSLGLWKFLFGPKESTSLSDSFVGSVLRKAYVPQATPILLFSAVAFFWYENVLIKFMPLLGSSLIPPLLIVLALLLADKSKIEITRPTVWYLGFLVVGVISAILAAARGLNPTMLILGWAIYAIFLVVMLASQSIEKKSLFLSSLFWLLVPSAILGVWQYATKSGLFYPTGESLGRAMGSFNNPNVFGMTLVIGLLTGVWMLMRNKNYLIAPFMVVMLLALLFSGSRTAWLSLIISVTVAVLVLRPKWLKYSPLAALLLFMPAIWRRISALFTNQYRYESSIDGRIWTTNNGIHLWQKYPIAGSGPGSFGGKLAEMYASPVALDGLQNGYRAIATTDNGYIEMLVQLGALGAISFLGFVCSTFMMVIRNRNIFHALSLSVLSGFLFMGFFSNVFEFNAVALPVAVILSFGLTIGPGTNKHGKI